MPLFEFIPFPVYFNFSSNVTVTPEVGPNNMIAVGHSESYQLLSSSDFQNCNKLGDTYFCKGIKCKFTVDGAQEKIFRLVSTPMWCTHLGKSAPTKSAWRQSPSRQYISHQGKQSRSTQAATSGPWTISSSRPMTARKSKSWTNGSIEPGLCHNYSNNPRAKWSSPPSTAYGPRSPAGSTLMSWSRSWRRWQRKPRHWPRRASSATGSSPHLEPWSEVRSIAWPSFSAVGGLVPGGTRPHSLILRHPWLPKCSTWRWTPSKDETWTKYIDICFVPFFMYLSF